MYNQLLTTIKNETDLTRRDLKDLLKFGSYYSLGLISYYLYPVLNPEPKSVMTSFVIISNVLIVLSFIVGGLTFGLAAKRFSISRLLKYSIFVTAIGSLFVSLFLFLKPLNNTAIWEKWILGFVLLGRLILSFGFSASFGLSVTLVVENFYRYKRTWATAFVCGIGFLGPLFAVALVWGMSHIFKESPLKIDWMVFLIVGALHFVFIAGESNTIIQKLSLFPKFQSNLSFWGKIPLESLLRKQNNKDAQYKKPLLTYLIAPNFRQKTFLKRLPKGIKDFLIFIKDITNTIDSEKNQRKKTAFTFWNALLMGIGVQFCFYLVLRVSNFNVYAHIFSNSTHANYIATVLRALGVIVGTFCVANWSKRTAQRRTILICFQFLQAIAIFYFFLPTFNAHEFEGYTYWSRQIYFSVWTFCLGFSNGIWFLFFLQVAEHISIAYRPTVLVLMPNIYRVSTLILVLYQDQLSMHPTALLWCGLGFIALSLCGTFNIKDNFEGDALVVDEDGNKSLFSTELKHQIAKIDNGLIIEEDIKQYLENMNNILFNDFKAQLNNHFFINNIFYFDENNTKDMGSVLSKFNKAAYDQYQMSSVKPIEFHRIARKLVNKGYCTSLARYTTDNPNLSGIFLWRSAQYQILNSDESPEYRAHPEEVCYAQLDLSSIKINNINKYLKLISEELTDEETKTLLNDLIENANFDELNAWKGKTRTFEDIFKTQGKTNLEIKKIKANILLHRLDAEDYPKGGYYTYFIKPAASSQDLKGCLFMKTVIPLKRIRLGQLRDIITVIMLQRANVSLVRTNADILDEDSHSKRHELEYLLTKIKDLNKILKSPHNREQYINQYGRIIESVTKHIYNITTINFHLMKYPPTNRIYPGHEDWKFFENEKISLKSELLGVVNIVAETFSLLNITSREHSKKALEALLELRKRIEQNMDDSITITALKPMIHVIIAEILKNAAFYTDNLNPWMDIQFYQNPKGDYELHFYNNRCMSLAAYNYIQKGIEKEDKKEDGLNGRTRGGIRTIKRYIRTPYLNHANINEKWALTVNKTSLDENICKTDIYLTIPLEDIS
jgi:MFS family permease